MRAMPLTDTAPSPIIASAAELPASDRSWHYLRPLLQTLAPSLTDVALERRGCVISNSKFGLDYFARQYADAARDPQFRDEVMGHTLAQKSAQLLELQGPCLSIASACSTGLHNIIFAAQRILNGDADVMVCGAAEAAKVPVIEAAFDNMGVISKRGLCTPFDKDRDGFVMGEGAGVCLLRKDETSKRLLIADCGMRIAELNQSAILNLQSAILLGWAMTNDSTHAVHFDESGQAIAVAIQKALKMAELSPADIDLIYVHGTGTVANDRIEANALRLAFGKALSNIPITSTKGMTGHLLGAAGAVEIALACEMLVGQFIYPTHCLNKDAAFADLNIVVASKARHPSAGWNPDPFEAAGNLAGSTAGDPSLRWDDGPMKTILKLNYGFGGQIGAIVLQRV